MQKIFSLEIFNCVKGLHDENCLCYCRRFRIVSIKREKFSLKSKLLSIIVVSNFNSKRTLLLSFDRFSEGKLVEI